MTAVVVHEGALLLVREPVMPERDWSLPGGTWEPGESLADGCAREVLEETGLPVVVGDLLYVAEVPDREPRLLHVTFRCALLGEPTRLRPGISGSTPIMDVCFVPFRQLTSLGFSEPFRALAERDFPDRGRYVGSKANIGL